MADPMPMRRCSAAGTSAWVIVVGCSARDSVPPRLTASFTSCRWSRKRNASVSPPSRSKEMTEPGARHCCRYTAQVEVVHAPHLRMVVQELGDIPRVFHLRRHAHGERLKTAQQEPARPRVG